ncbi:hypothetical protein AWC26_21060 [Mycobacterium shimoidei]|nr:STAS/SEC14 domain-containing protein [Mycobacterium shimoidei]ODR13556.1 hypothetical protein BHQ16_09410 [Mycobacterium shimoidei]ORW76531.1 hypothetical protein AWC26_21060 [Mycobacterium shimoidei]
MISVMDESSGNVIGFRATARLTRSDYQVLQRLVEDLLKRFASASVLFLMDDAFEGWSLRAAWANTIFDLKHRRDFGKIAMVGCPRWEEWCVKLAAAPLMVGELRTFRREELGEAWRWLRS